MNFIPAVPTFTQQSYGKDFGNWQRYAGLGQNQSLGQDASQPVRAPQGAVAAVPPPAESMGDLMKQAISPIMDQAKSALGTVSNVANAAGQLSQGNVVGAYNTYKGSAPSGSSDYQYHTAIGQ
jgi:hypothetical protein